MKVALVHDCWTQRSGAERVFELLCKRFPKADIFTSLYHPEKTIDLGDRPVHTTNLPVPDLILSSLLSFAKITINYPIDDSRFIFFDRKQDFYLVSSRLLSYKRVDVIIETFNWLDWSLLISGEGQRKRRFGHSSFGCDWHSLRSI
jgi:glycosyltransferase involved in cell wall biosynthesis